MLEVPEAWLKVLKGCFKGSERFCIQVSCFVFRVSSCLNFSIAFWFNQLFDSGLQRIVLNVHALSFFQFEKTTIGPNNKQTQGNFSFSTYLTILSFRFRNLGPDGHALDCRWLLKT